MNDLSPNEHKILVQLSAVIEGKRYQVAADFKLSGAQNVLGRLFRRGFVARRRRYISSGSRYEWRISQEGMGALNDSAR